MAEEYKGFTGARGKKGGQVLEFATELARDAGRLLMRHVGRLGVGDIDHKGKVDLVTAADRASEAFIVGRLLETFPSHAVVAEETRSAAGDDSHRWIVDPLDGTTNFVHGYPFFAVSIALEVKGELRLGVVHAPMLRETFSAARGQGARLNAVEIRVSSVTRLIDALLATGFAYDRWERERNNLEEFARLTMATQGVRRGGAASLDLAYVAAGRLDGFWEMGLAPWDVAAGALLVEEAGGRVTTLAGAPGVLASDDIGASNGVLHEVLLEALRKPM